MATTVEVTEVSQANISRIVRAYGNITAQDNVRITPQVSERITAIYADLGDTVAQGQLLAKIRDINFRDQVQRDEAQLEQARLALRRDSLEFNRANALYDRNLISDAEMENIRTSFQNSRAQYRAAIASLTSSRESLGFTEVRSPVRGVVTRRNISPGDVAGTGSVIFEIANLVGYEKRIYLPLSDRRLVRIGQPVSLRLTGEREASASGIVSRISPELDPVTGLAEVVISLTNISGQILPGSLAESSITVETRSNAIVIPRTALVEQVQTLLDPESNTIRLVRDYTAFVAIGDSLAEQRPLEIGLQQGDRIEIVSGLAPGEKLVITGQGGLEDGSRIRVSGLGRPGAPQARQIQRGDAPAQDAPTDTVTTDEASNGDDSPSEN